MKPTHKRIWLQGDEPFTTWCQDKIHDTDVEYVAVSEIREAVERVSNDVVFVSDTMGPTVADDDARAVLRALLAELLEEAP